MQLWVETLQHLRLLIYQKFHFFTTQFQAETPLYLTKNWKEAAITYNIEAYRFLENFFLKIYLH